MPPLIAQRDRQHHEGVPSLLRQELQELEPALQLPAQELQELRQLHARPVVIELVRVQLALQQSELVLQLALQQSELVLQLALQQLELLQVQNSAWKYLVE
jgi:hypothetical protein